MGDSGDRRGDDAARLFREAMRGVEPLADRPPVPAPPKRRARRPARRSGRRRFVIDRFGERVEGLAAGVDPAEVLHLQRGEVPVDLRLDLHGLGVEEARVAVRDALARAGRAGLRCVLVVHGRGRRSPGDPVLKERLPGWLIEPPHGRRVLAFTTAGPGQGGSGATVVLLRSK